MRTRQLFAPLFLVPLALVAGCVFNDHGLAENYCDREGEVDDRGRVCENGFWSAPESVVFVDMSMDAVDVGPTDPCDLCSAGELCCGPSGDPVCIVPDDENCGACGTVCGASTTCAGGECVCAIGLSNCDADPTTCETDLLTDPMNCGQCGTSCPAGLECINGACLCGDTFCGAEETCCADAEGNPTCVDTSMRADNCGACGTVCKATEVCSDGACQCGDGAGCGDGEQCCLGMCGDENLPCACGLGEECGEDELCCAETCVAIDGANCGSCSNACRADQNCPVAAATCTCLPGTTPCGQTCVDLADDVANCGACGNACGAGSVCCTGACVVGDQLACEWWNPAWAHRVRIELGTDAALPAGYPVGVVIPHPTWIAASQALASGNDIRLLRWDGATWTELPRVQDPVAPFNRPDGTATRIWFRLAAPLAAGQADDSYFVYFGNGTATAPGFQYTDVFLAADDFDDLTIDPSVTIENANGASTDLYAGGVMLNQSVQSGAANQAHLLTAALPADRQFDAVVQLRVNYSLDAQYLVPSYLLNVDQSPTRPGPDTNTNVWGRAVLMAVYYYSSDFSLAYRDPGGTTQWDWSSAWTLANGPLDGQEIGPSDQQLVLRLWSDGTQWAYVSNQIANNTLDTTTATRLWSQTVTDGNPLWLSIGEPNTELYRSEIVLYGLRVREFNGTDATSVVGATQNRP